MRRWLGVLSLCLPASGLILAPASVPATAQTQPKAAQTQAAQTGASQTEAGPTLTVRLGEMLHRVEGGHGLSAEELAGAGDVHTVTKEDLRTAVPLLGRGLASPDGDLRRYTLTVLQGLEGRGGEDPAGVKSAEPAVPSSAGVVVSSFPPDAARELAALVPKIAAGLKEERETNRLLAVTVLGGFAPSPPAGVLVALTGYLRRDDAIGPVGQTAVEDLLAFTPVSAETAAAIGRYLRRGDQTAESRAGLVDSIAARGDRSTLVNGALLGYLDGDDPGVRARLILSLPLLDLAPELYAEVRARVALIAQNNSENLQVVTAARAVTTCWTSVRMTTGCPAY